MHTLRGFHPLLLLKNKALGKKVIPFDLHLHDPNRILVLSGPNAGGKSITMKSVGLLQIMMQAGFLVPVEGQSEMGIFHGLFADIGDQQSIEDDLSTYSSRLQNMKVFLEKANERTLILIDEFGSGTDPKTGGAIAEAILKELNGNSDVKDRLCQNPGNGRAPDMLNVDRDWLKGVSEPIPLNRESQHPFRADSEQTQLTGIQTEIWVVGIVLHMFCEMAWDRPNV